jgi:hypothetical protein
MKYTMTRHVFIDMMKAQRPDNFTYEALNLLWDHFEEWEQDTGEEVDFDCISICCDFSEDTPEAIAQNYSIDTEGMTEGQALDEVMQTLKDNGAFIGQTDSGAIVYLNY